MVIQMGSAPHIIGSETSQQTTTGTLSCSSWLTGLDMKLFLFIKYSSNNLCTTQKKQRHKCSQHCTSSCQHPITYPLFGVCGVDDDALKTRGLDTRNILGSMVAKVPNTSSEIP
jgi:hypothetical protein